MALLRFHCGILCLIFVCLACFPAGAGLSATARICNKFETFYLKAECIKTKILSSKNDTEKEALFNVMINYWNKKDGSMGYTISDIFLDILEVTPEFFFSEMANFPTEFDEWLSRLGSLSFTWYNDPPSPLQTKKENLIKFLSEYHPSDKSLDQYKLKTLETIRAIIPRQVE